MTQSMSPPRPATAAAGPLVDATRFAADAPHIRQSAAGHHMYEKLISIWATGLIEAAYDLGVFERLTVAPVTSDALAAQLGTEPRATRVLCAALMVYGVLTCDGDGRFAVPADVALCFVDGG